MVESQEKSRAPFVWRSIRLVVLQISITGCALFATYGGWGWAQAWALLAFWLVYYLLAFVYGMRRNPEVIVERSLLFNRGFQAWDRWILPLYEINALLVYIVGGLDTGRFGWSDVPNWAMWVGLALVIPAFALPFWATMNNPFASCSVSIQTESGHYTVSSGPYSYVRHPMYLAVIPFGLGFPLFLGSYWALIPGILAVALFVVRTAFEDSFLMENLEGYREYSDRVRWRLVPGVW